MMKFDILSDNNLDHHQDSNVNNRVMEYHKDEPKSYTEHDSILKRDGQRNAVEKIAGTASSSSTSSSLAPTPTPVAVVEQRPLRTIDAFLENAYNIPHRRFGNSNSFNDSNNSSNSFSCSFRHQWKYWLVMFSLGVANSSDASEILCISYIISDSSFQNNMLHESSGWEGGLLAAAVFMGMLLGGLFIGTLGDYCGRKPTLLFGLICNSFAGICSSFAPNILTLSLLRAIAGVGIGASVPPLFTLVAELAPPSKRGYFVSFCAAFWMVGSVYVAVTALICFQINATSWRVFALLCAVPSFLGSILVWWIVPESPRFLALQGKCEQAVNITNYIAIDLMRCRSIIDPYYLEEMKHYYPIQNDNSRQIRHQNIATSPTIERKTNNNDYYHHGNNNITTDRNFHLNHLSNTSNITNQHVQSFWKKTIDILLKWKFDFIGSVSTLYTPYLTRVTLPLQMIWFSLSFGSYGLSTWINTLFFAIHLDNVYFNALLFAAANLPGNIISMLFMDRFGRSNMLIGSIVTASISLLAFARFANLLQNQYDLDAAAELATTSVEGAVDNRQTHFYSIGVVASACAFQCFSIVSWNTVDVMTSELFPTTVRSTGMGVCAASGRIGAMIAQFVNSMLVTNGGPVGLLLVASVTLLLGAITPCLLPKHVRDMSNQPVQDNVSAAVHNNDRDP